MQTTMELHWGKHHRTYLTNLNKQIEGKPLDGKSLEEVGPRLQDALWPRRTAGLVHC